MDAMIIENSSLVRESLRRALTALPELRLVTEAEDGQTALALLEASRPDLVLLDLSPFSNATLGTLERIRLSGQGCRIVVLTDAPYPRFCQLCLELGADAVFDKSMEFDQLVDQVKEWLPPLPANESERIRLLEGLDIIDSPPEKSFDDLAALAAAIAGTPIALVSLVSEDRQWFKACVGLDVRETSRSIAFCAHAINSREAFIVEDALEDPRFATNPLVRGAPNIRFYAGFPLVMSGGEILGTLCVIDGAPHSLSEGQKQALQTLSRSVVNELELRLQLSALERERNRRHAAENLATQLTTRDSLTGLANRATLVDRLGQAVRLAHRQQRQAAFMFVDIDHFRWVNDTLGHEVGDRLLRTVADRLTVHLRESDTVARLGGDEFGIVLPTVDGPQAAQAIGEKLLAALARPVEIGHHKVMSHCSLGIALYPDHGLSDEALMRYADLALGDAKESGGNTWRFFAESMGRQAQERLLMEADLRAALDNGEIEPWYQPQVDFSSGSLVALEALLRWHHPRLGQVSPLRFIPLAEQCGFIWELGAFVLEQALAQLAAWEAAGLRIPRVAVNVSALQLQPRFAPLVKELLDKYRLTPDRLELEITESTFALDGPQLLAIVRELSALGVGFAVDDFGVGYSSLAQLKRFPVSTLKIDRAFTEELASNTQNRAIVQAITALSHTLGMRTVAEGVEDAAQSSILKQLGCDDAQGYHHGRPMPAAHLDAWLGLQVRNLGVKA